MRTLSANAIKHPHSLVTQNQVPREGTLLREIYNIFMEKKGQVVYFRVPKNNPRVLDALTDYYGLDLRHIGRNKWCLCGEWFGKVYVGYVAQHLSSLNASSKDNQCVIHLSSRAPSASVTN